jgi:hypothetical protein
MGILLVLRPFEILIGYSNMGFSKDITTCGGGQGTSPARTHIKP